LLTLEAFVCAWGGLLKRSLSPNPTILLMQMLGLVDGCVRAWWLDQGFGNEPLIFRALTEDGLLLKGSLCRVVGCTNDEIREAAPLPPSCPFQPGMNACR
jgi:hypothetical protein